MCVLLSVGFFVCSPECDSFIISSDLKWEVKFDYFATHVVGDYGNKYCCPLAPCLSVCLSERLYFVG